MKIDKKIKDEILRYDVNTEAAKITALSKGKIVTFAVKLNIKTTWIYLFPTWKSIWKTKTIEDQWDKQTKAIQKYGK